jgi:protein-tyrosine-phosphatase/DNA-binding transcriptional ArsR family regulator
VTGVLPPPELRAARHAALGDPTRVVIVDELRTSDRSPVELQRRLRIGSNLLAHHLDVLSEAGLVERFRSSGDGRRRYVHLVAGALDGLVDMPRSDPAPALFVCTHNSARSQLAAALWRQTTGRRATSAGTEPAERVHPGAVAAARRAGLDLGDARPRRLGTLPTSTTIVTVCDRAHEELAALEPAGAPETLHWSVPDPVPAGRARDFDAVVDDLRARIAAATGRRAA